jgi:hypothetical protein
MPMKYPILLLVAWESDVDEVEQENEIKKALNSDSEEESLNMI